MTLDVTGTTYVGGVLMLQCTHEYSPVSLYTMEPLGMTVCGLVWRDKANFVYKLWTICYVQKRDAEFV